MKTTKQKIYRTILLLFGVVAILVVIVIPFYLEKKIEDMLERSHGRASDIHLNLLTRSISLDNFELYAKEGRSFNIRFNTLEVHGINVYSLLFQHEAIIQEIKADSGTVLYDKVLQKEKANSPDSKLDRITVENIQLSAILCEIRTDTVVNFSGVLNVRVTGIQIQPDSTNQIRYTFSEFGGVLSNINISRTSGMYGATIQNIRFNSQERSIIIDSALLIPNYTKFEFAHEKGEQVARLNLSVPKISVENVDIKKIMDSTFIASKIEILSFDLHSFKDKRIPFLRDYRIPLPIESFSKVAYTITVDSLVIQDSRVTIEEISEEGTESGIVTFNHINASCSWFSNRYKQGDPASVTLHATGLLMNSGEIKAAFTFPLDGSPLYTTKGSIKNLPFEALNPALENLVRFRIESGKLNNMKFEFEYNDLVSTGMMEIDYEDLQLTGLKKKKDGNNDFKTLLVNALVKNDKTGTSPKLQRTGTITIERDRRKYVFNVWWKSILDGLLSTVLGRNRKPDQSKK